MVLYAVLIGPWLVKLSVPCKSVLFICAAKWTHNSAFKAVMFDFWNAGRMVTSCCYKLLECPVTVKDKDTRDAIFQVLGLMVKKYGHALSKPSTKRYK